ncbi:hypothetical protein T265_05129 [Opisthorchis viverrini]|uniref:GDA1/CD39 family protein n=1 Tax=Opisthorchis viverrini TaxID=6198 RepID=A0A075AFM6_OPIVI|nr:hypothetical protein T265_05129 [Opisthorchis viverrini]KER27924.1 hypothetical protein T265_05129 [Opisthorchis viverrini]
MRPFAHRKIEERPSTDMLLRDLLICILQMTVAHALVIPGDMKYVVIVDAGSSGSRVYVYTWRDGSGLKSPELLKDEFGRPVVKKTSPGLSSFAHNPKDARKHIDDLLDFAESAIPKSYLSGTHVYVFATAGMRLLSAKYQCLIWRNVRSEIRSRYSFEFANTDARTISGDEEALFGWIAVNYLLQRFDRDEYEKQRKSTYGMLDLGGASMQIAFELEPKTRNSTNVFPLSLRTKSSEDYGSSLQSYALFLHSYLSYGANFMRKRHEEVLLFKHLPPWADPEKPVTIADPCLQKGLTISTTLSPKKPNDTESLRENEEEKKYQVELVGEGDPDKCKVLVRELVLGGEMGKGPSPPIGFEMPFYGLSEFVYALEGVSSKEIYLYSEAEPKIEELCRRPWEEYTKILREQYGDEETYKKFLKIKMHHCFKAIYVVTVLHDGFKFPKTYDKLHRVNEINGTDVQWSLGAIFFILNSEDGQANQESRQWA